MFYGLMISCETDGHESKPSSKGRSRITTGGKPHRMKNSIRLVVLMGIMRLWVGLRAILPKSTCPRKNQFVAGGWNRGSALAHLQLSEVECSGGHLSGNNSREKEERREKREERWPHHSRVASQRGHRSRQLRAHHHQGFLADRNLRAR